MRTRSWISLPRALSILVLLFAMAPRPARAGHVNFTYGDRNIDGDFKPLDGHDVYGLTMFTGKEGWPLEIVLGLNHSRSDRASGTDLDPLFGMGAGSLVCETNEVDVGVARIWNSVPHTYVFIGGGLALLDARLESHFSAFDASDDDSSIGPYVHGGVFWRLGPALNLGFEVRFAKPGEVDLLGETFKTEYTQFAWLAGWGW